MKISADGEAGMKNPKGLLRKERVLILPVRSAERTSSCRLLRLGGRKTIQLSNNQRYWAYWSVISLLPLLLPLLN